MRVGFVAGDIVVGGPTNWLNKVHMGMILKVMNFEYDP